jgi:hypothetical protein
MNKQRIVLCALLGLTGSSTGLAAVIARTCAAFIDGGGGRTGGGEVATTTPPCSLDFSTSTAGVVGFVLTPQGSYGGTMQTTFVSNWSDFGGGFTIDTSLAGTARYQITSGLVFPDGPGYNTVSAGIFENGWSRESFSVDKPYAFTLDYGRTDSSSTSTTLGTSIFTEGILSVSENLLNGPGEDLIQLNGKGTLNGTLEPGKTYWLNTNFDLTIEGGAADGKTETSSVTWGGTFVHLKAGADPVAVPEAPTGLLLGGALALVLLSRRSRPASKSAGS